MTRALARRERTRVPDEAVEGVQERGEGLATPRRRMDQRVLAACDGRPTIGLGLGRGLEARGEPVADGRAERRERIRACERGHGTCQYRFPPPNRPDVLTRPPGSWPRDHSLGRKHAISCQQLAAAGTQSPRHGARCRPAAVDFCSKRRLWGSSQPRRWPAADEVPGGGLSRRYATLSPAEADMPRRALRRHRRFHRPAADTARSWLR